MKKHYSTLAALILGAFFVNAFGGEAPKTVNIQQVPAGTTITIDGKADEDVWKKAVQHSDFRLYAAEAAQDKGATDIAGYWQAAWATDGIYVLVAVTVDDVLSVYTADETLIGNPWEQDGIEIYFDMNTANLHDGGGKGGKNGPGHYDFYATRDTTITQMGHFLTEMGLGSKCKAWKVQDGNKTIVETFISWENILDKDSVAYTPDPTKPIGFDIGLIDHDKIADRTVEASPRTRKYWSSNSIKEPWEQADSIAVATLVTTPVAIQNTTASLDINAYASNNVLHISKSIQGRLLNMVGQEVLSINGNSANVSGLKAGAYILVTNDNKFHKKLIIK